MASPEYTNEIYGSCIKDVRVCDKLKQACECVHMSLPSSANNVELCSRENMSDSVIHRHKNALYSYILYVRIKIIHAIFSLISD